MMENMQQTMMKRYQMFAWMGLLIVMIAFLFSLQVAGANGAFFGATKTAREGAAAGSALVQANVTRHTLTWWVPAFKFVGLGVMLGSITMALGLIATTLRNLGGELMSRWPAELNPGLPEKPRAARMFPMLMMMGLMVLILGLILAWATVGTVGGYWSHSIANELNPAGTGSTLLQTLGSLQALGQWLGILRFLGMALLFTAITVALTVVVRTLQHQEGSLKQYIKGQMNKA
jgi:hypothetical protein